MILQKFFFLQFYSFIFSYKLSIAIFLFETSRMIFLNGCINKDVVSALVKYDAKSLLQNSLSTYTGNISYLDFFSIDIKSPIINLIKILDFIKQIE